MYRKLTFILGILSLLSAVASGQSNFTLQSPDRSISIFLTIGDSIKYRIELDGKPTIANSAIGFFTDKNSSNEKLQKTKFFRQNDSLLPVVWQKSNVVKDDYHALQLNFKGGLSLEWRAYNNGVAWHWRSSTTDHYVVKQELAEINLGPEAASWFPEENSFYSHNERKYIHYKASDIDQKKLASLPVLFDSKGVKILLTESNLFNYAGMWVTGDGNGIIKGTFPKFPKDKRVSSDRDEEVVSREDFIAGVSGAQDFPWRILMIARSDKELLTNQLPYLLGRPQAAGMDFSWVKPGKVQWDWWHYNNVYNVPFRAGINNDTYKYYIDFAAGHHIGYVLLDEGWCDTRDLMKQSKDIDVQELVRYARQRDVGILLWTSWLVLGRQLDMALDSFSVWGVKGIKVDFMQRDDQEMVNYYERVSKAAAERHLLVDFHGAYKPTGWSRTYPNVMTSEGVMGNELSKFTGAITPEHTLTIPFIRMAAGPMDFTPGGMRNAQKDAFAAVPSEPMTLGTRCNQMAMYVIYESPLQMLCDIPTHYLEEEECMQFLSAVPTTWRSSIPLEGKVGQYVAMARQAADGRWFVGAMTDWSPRKIDLHFDFLPAGHYELQLWKDGPNSDRNAKDYSKSVMQVDNSSVISVELAPGGGFAGILKSRN